MEKGFSIACVIGDDILGHSGATGQMLAALGRHSIPVRATAQGSSERNISVIVPSERADEAIRAIHHEFFDRFDTEVIPLFIAGYGRVGKALVEMLRDNADAIARMKKGVVLVNTSRGALIDAEALLEGIKARQIGAACLDVYEEEADVFFEDRSGHILNDDLLSRLISMPNVIVTSHQAFLTEEALNNIAETTVGNILSCFEKDGLCDNELCYRCGRIEQCRKERKGRCF